MRTCLAIAVAGALIGVMGCGGTRDKGSADLTGGGSTFIEPLMERWQQRYSATDGGCNITYWALGSGSGVKKLINKSADFACTDAPFSDEQLAEAQKAGGQVVHIPLVLGAVVPVYNLDEVKEPIKFTGAALADIYLGKVKYWDDEPLKSLNEGVHLPHTEIVVVNRRESSGTTYIWTDYLSKVSTKWSDEVGRGTEPKWKVGEEQQYNEGVANRVKDKPGAIGYLELSYAHVKDLQTGRVENREHEYPRANLETIMAAAENALKEKQISEDLRYSLTDAPGHDSYPICGTTWAVVYVNQEVGKRNLLVHFLDWALDDGQGMAAEQFYAKLPPSLLERARKNVEKIQAMK